MSNVQRELMPKGELLHTYKDGAELYENGAITLPPPSERVIHQPVWLDVRCPWCRSMNVIGQDTTIRPCFHCGHTINQE